MGAGTLRSFCEPRTGITAWEWHRACTREALTWRPAASPGRAAETSEFAGVRPSDRRWEGFSLMRYQVTASAVRSLLAATLLSTLPGTATAGIGCHDPCLVGDAIDPNCSPVVSAVCARESDCCEVGWSSNCVLLVA